MTRPRENKPRTIGQAIEKHILSYLSFNNFYSIRSISKAWYILTGNKVLQKQILVPGKSEKALNSLVDAILEKNVNGVRHLLEDIGVNPNEQYNREIKDKDILSLVPPVSILDIATRVGSRGGEKEDSESPKIIQLLLHSKAKVDYNHSLSQEEFIITSAHPPTLEIRPPQRPLPRFSSRDGIYTLLALADFENMIKGLASSYSLPQGYLALASHCDDKLRMPSTSNELDPNNIFNRMIGILDDLDKIIKEKNSAFTRKYIKSLISTPPEASFIGVQECLTPKERQWLNQVPAFISLNKTVSSNPVQQVKNSVEKLMTDNKEELLEKLYIILVSILMGSGALKGSIKGWDKSSIWEKIFLVMYVFLIVKHLYKNLYETRCCTRQLKSKQHKIDFPISISDQPSTEFKYYSNVQALFFKPFPIAPFPNTSHLNPKRVQYEVPDSCTNSSSEETKRKKNK